jgi:hypothetical protein
MPAMRMLLLLLLSFIFLVAATLSQLTTMPRPFLKGSMPAGSHTSTTHLLLYTAKHGHLEI